ncbi:hypothetical protein MMC14_007380 [Varicellaria rhodocarpa]|nr:hypothetical protein [Varicellaria rhodocarpa]
MASPSPTGLLNPEGPLGNHTRKHFYHETTTPRIKFIISTWNDPYPPPNEAIQINLRGHTVATKAHLFDQATDIIAVLQRRSAPITNDHLVEAFITGKPNLFFAQWWNRAQIITLPNLRVTYEKCIRGLKDLEAQVAADVKRRGQQGADEKATPTPATTTISRKRRATKSLSQPTEQQLSELAAARDQQIQELQRHLELAEQATTITATPPSSNITLNAAVLADVVVSSAKAPVLVAESFVEGRSSYTFEGNSKSISVSIGYRKEDD